LNLIRFAPDLARLFRIRLSLFVALSAAAGNAAATFRLTSAILLPSLACALLAAGASTLNQWQEWRRDSRMSRTRKRPIPTGKIAPVHALVIGLGLTGTAIVVLAVSCGAWATAFGASAVVMYNGVYTWMKRWTAFAAVPGALIGALGPAIGWVAGGGVPQSPTLLAISMVFFLWQVPHFWLLNLKYPTDYGAAGYPSPVAVFGGDRLYRIGLVWIACTVLATLCLPLFGLLSSGALYLILCFATVLLGAALVRAVRSSVLDTGRYRLSFASVNLFVLVIMILLIVESGL